MTHACIPLPAADHSHIFGVIPVVLRVSVRVQKVVMGPKRVRQEAKPAAYQHLTKAIPDGYDSHEEARFPPW